MYRSFIIAICLSLLFTQSSFSITEIDSSRIDSLKHEIKTSNSDESLGNAYYELTNIYYEFNADSAIYYGIKYLEISEKLNDTVWIAEAQNNLAYAYDKKGEILLALDYFQKALENFEIIQDTYLIAASYCNIGYMTSYGADQEKGLSYFLKSMKIAETIQDSALISDVSINIGYYYDRVGDNQTAYRYYKKSLEIDKILKDSVALGLSYSNIASMNYILGHLDSAKSNLSQAKKMVTNSFSILELTYLYSAIAECYIEMKLVDSSQIYIDKTAKLLSIEHSPLLYAYLYEQKGNIAYLTHDYTNCIDLLDISIESFHKINMIEPLLDVYQLKAKAFKALGNYSKAYQALQMANEMNDTLGFGILANMLGEFEQDRIYRIELDQQKLQAALENQKYLANKIAMRSNLRIAIYSIILLLVTVAIVVYFLLKIREKNKILEINNFLIEDQKSKLENNVHEIKASEESFKELNATKDKFFSIIGHDLKNPFSSIAGLTQLLVDDKEMRQSDDLLTILESLNKTANYGYALLENLLSWAQSQTGSIEPQQLPIKYSIMLEMVILDLETQAKSKNIELVLNNTDKSVQVIADENMVTTVLRNLIHNAIKFSYENSTIKITTQKRGKRLITCVEDQGLGIPEEHISGLFAIDRNFQKNGTKNEKGTGLGLILCKEFVQKNNGKIWVESPGDKGSKFFFTLPIKTNKKRLN